MWKPCPAADQVVTEAMADVIARSAWLKRFEQTLHAQTGEMLLRRIDHLAVPAKACFSKLEDAGFTVDEQGPGESMARHLEAYVPTIRLRTDDRYRVALAVDRVENFAKRYEDVDSALEIEGVEGSTFRRLRVASEDSIDVWVVERWGSTAWALDDHSSAGGTAAAHHLAVFRNRPRTDSPNEELFRSLRETLGAAIDDIGEEWTTALFFRAEREHWVRHTPEAQVQASRHDALGLGWAHHDHHTYRSSRGAFHELIATLERLGLEPRERFHAGAEAGWGAQVMSHPTLPFVVFADVDMSENELTGDFTHTPLSPRESLGTVGLWCALHGEAIFGAGLHHLACHYDFDAVREQLATHQVQTMDPFADLPELRQCFTVGTRRRVSKGRVDALLAQGAISLEQAQQFTADGALGSHLEIIERQKAYKGFHQRGISSIIQETDPRKAY